MSMLCRSAHGRGGDRLSFPLDVIHLRWPYAIVGVNTDVIWAETFSDEPVEARIDGWWGPHEYAILPFQYDKTSPYLAWIPALSAYRDVKFTEHTGLDPTLALLSFDEYPFKEFPLASHASILDSSHPFSNLPSKPTSLHTTDLRRLFVSTSDRMQAVVKEKTRILMSDVRQAFDALEKHPMFRHLRLPEQALFRLQQAYYWILLPGTVTVAGHILVLAGLKRAVLELHGFLLWKKDHDTPVAPPPCHPFRPKPFKTRGAYVDNLEDYNAIRRHGVAVYMEVDLGDYLLSSVKQVALSPIPIHRQVLIRQAKLKHYAYLYFYPPIVEDFTLYELAARGYASRLDVYNPDAAVDTVYATVLKDGRFAKGIYFPLPKCPGHHLLQQAENEYVGLQPFTPNPPLQEWSRSRGQMELPPAFKGPGRPPATVTPVPPPTFFFRCANAEKQKTFFYIWACMRHRWLTHLYETPHDSRAQFFLTHQQWRDVLSGDRFKKAAKKMGSLTFKLEEFWNYDTSLFQRGSGEAEGPYVYFRQVGVVTRLSPDRFLNISSFAFQLKRIFCYDIALTHIKYQFEETDEIIMRRKNVDSLAMQDRRCRRSTLFRDSLNFTSSTPDWESDDLAVKSAWFERLRTFIHDWPKVYEDKPHCDKSLTGLPDSAFHRELHILLIAYYSGIVQSLNTIPTVMWTYPGMDVIVTHDARSLV